jgi:hypothetical protein
MKELHKAINYAMRREFDAYQLSDASSICYALEEVKAYVETISDYEWQISISITDWGISGYLSTYTPDYRYLKIRLSDHAATNQHRRETELMYDFVDGWTIGNRRKEEIERYIYPNRFQRVETRVYIDNWRPFNVERSKFTPNDRNRIIREFVAKSGREMYQIEFQDSYTRIDYVRV